MNNHYRFERLKKSELSSDESRQGIYASMVRSTLSGGFIRAFESVADLRPHLSRDHYYIAHRLVASKGRKAIFKGGLYKAERADLLDFLDDAVVSGDLRELLMMSVEPHPGRHVIYIADDVFYLYAADEN